jgi:hypothetical protein
MHTFIHRFSGKIQIFINDFSHLLIRRPYAMADDRLQRMEDKIDRMSQAIIAMARKRANEALEEGERRLGHLKT